MEFGSSAGTLTIDQAAPKYEQLYARLIGDVQTGRLKPGDLLPPEPKFAVQLNIARSTVRQALAQMERNGLVRRIRGKGTYIHEDASLRLRSGLDAFALIVPDAVSGYYPSLMTGFEQAAGAVRNQVIVVSTHNEAGRQGDAILQLIDKQVAGVAIVPATTPATPAYQVRQLQKHNIPVVLCHREVEGVRAPVLSFSGHDIGRLAGEAMLRRGHRRVAFVSALRTVLAENYEQGLRSALKGAGVELSKDDVVYLGKAGLTDPEAYERTMDEALTTLMSRPPSQRPTAIFTGFDATAELIYLQLMRRGVSVPDDMSLVSFGGVSRLGPMQSRLTAVTVDETMIGRFAADLLDEMRSGKRQIDSDERIEIALGFHEGQTLADARA